jgi:hypothetical protein
MYNTALFNHNMRIYDLCIVNYLHKQSDAPYFNTLPLANLTADIFNASKQSWFCSLVKSRTRFLFYGGIKYFKVKPVVIEYFFPKRAIRWINNTCKSSSFNVSGVKKIDSHSIRDLIRNKSLFVNCFVSDDFLLF